MEHGKEKPVITRCPHCNTKVTYKGLANNPHFPFCNRRCKMIDLGRWLDEEYKIQTEPREPGE